MTETNGAITTETKSGGGYIEVIKFETPESEAQFKAQILELVQNPAELSMIFPKVFELKYLQGGSIGDDDRLARIPVELLNSDTYTNKSELKEKMKKIILETQRQRHLNGYSLLDIIGEGWGEDYDEKMEEIKKLDPYPKRPEPIINYLNTEAPSIGSLPMAPKKDTSQPRVLDNYDFGSETYTVRAPGVSKQGYRIRSGKIKRSDPSE